MYTSYFGLQSKLLNSGYTNLVSIAGKSPKFFNPSKNIYLKEYKILAPKYWWWKKWKDENLGEQYYIDMYYKTVLDKLNPFEVYKELGSNAVLLCYEKPNEFCHRHIVADWLFRTTGNKVMEIVL